MMLSRHTHSYLHSNTGPAISSANVVRVEPGAGITRERDPANPIYSFPDQNDTGNSRNQNTLHPMRKITETAGPQAPPVWSRMQGLADALSHLGEGAGPVQNQVIFLTSQASNSSQGVTGNIVRLHNKSGDGHDVVHIAPGAETVIQLGPGIDSWQSQSEGDDMVLLLSEGSIRFEGVANSGAIGVVLWGDNRVKFLHLPPVLNKSV